MGHRDQLPPGPTVVPTGEQVDHYEWVSWSCAAPFERDWTIERLAAWAKAHLRSPVSQEPHEVFAIVRLEERPPLRFASTCLHFEEGITVRFAKVKKPWHRR